MTEKSEQFVRLFEVLKDYCKFRHLNDLRNRPRGPYHHYPTPEITNGVGITAVFETSITLSMFYVDGASDLNSQNYDLNPDEVFSESWRPQYQELLAWDTERRKLERAQTEQILRDTDRKRLNQLREEVKVLEALYPEETL